MVSPALLGNCLRGGKSSFVFLGELRDIQGMSPRLKNLRDFQNFLIKAM